MSTVRQPDYDPAMFAPGPARDSRFDVQERWRDCNNLSKSDSRRDLEFLHRQMNEEVNSVECAARALVDFPSAEWELRMCIARQCYDEARHVEMFRRELERRGGQVGQSPVLNFQYRIVTNVDDLCGRLAVQNRSFEAEGVDAVEPEIAVARSRGDHELAGLFDAQLADEICHVRFANEYISRMSARDPASVMRIGRALNYSSIAFQQVMGREGTDAVDYSVNEAGRLEAGFSPEEVRLVVESRAGRTTPRTADSD